MTDPTPVPPETAPDPDPGPDWTPTERIDPALAALFANVPLESPTTRDEIARGRTRRLFADAPRSPEVVREDRLVPGRDGAPDVAIRIHRHADASDAPLPALLTIHGGGYIIGTHDDDDLVHDRFLVGAGLRYVGVSVAYRLAPETPYPGPLEDTYAALDWLFRNAADLGVDPTRIGVHGVSAGGGLAAALTLLARDRGEHRLAFSQLIYPMLDDRRTSVTSGWDVPLWKPASNELGWSCYLGDRFGTDDVPYLAAPGRATVEELRGLPPTFLTVGALDLFADEDLAYATRLNHAGVDVEAHLYPAMPHGFDVVAGFADGATRGAADIVAWLRTRLV